MGPAEAPAGGAAGAAAGGGGVGGGAAAASGAAFLGASPAVGIEWGNIRI